MPAVPVLRAVCLLFTLCLPCPLPSSFLPRSFCLPPSIPLCFVCYLLHVHVRQDHRLAGPAVCLSVRASSSQAARLPRRQQQRGSAVGARAPSCVHYTITGAARLPVGSRNMGTALEQPMRRCPLPRIGGGLGLHLGSRPRSPHLPSASQRLRVSSLAPC